MKRQSGFTLIELVVVIVILGILAVTAAPSFLDLTKDAKKSSLSGLKGAIVSASNITYAKSAVLGIEKQGTPTSTVDGIKVSFGYPLATAEGIAKSITGIDDWSAVASADGYFIGFKSSDTSYDITKLKATNCYVTYKKATSTSTAETKIIDSGC